jgi:DNA-binding NarL/FixJ family response regulator
MNSEPTRWLISICDDDGLRYSRELILRHADYEVVSVSSNATLEQLTSRPFDIAIICQSVEAGRAEQILEILKFHNAEIRVLCINSYPNRLRYAVGVDYQVPGRPTALLQAVAALRGEVRRSA